MSGPAAFDVEKFRRLLNDLRTQMPLQIEYEVLRAKLARERFRALVSAGFTEAQALDLVKGWGAP